MTSNVLEVTDLTTRFVLPSRVVRAVTEVSLEIKPGETLGLVGESGSGKTATAMSILGLLPRAGRVVGGSVRLEGKELLSLSESDFRHLRGDRMALVPQNPLAALNPMLSIGWQLREAITAHESVSRREADERAVEALVMTGLPAPAQQLNRFPHEFSGGMRQRILIAMAIVNRPVLLLADEPTTALDTTTQAQILELVRTLTEASKMGTLLITHNMGVVASIADRVAVMYAGEIVEMGTAFSIFDAPQHPYTQLLLSSTPGAVRRQKPNSSTTRATVNSAADQHVSGCRFRPRCELAMESCDQHPLLVDQRSGHSVRCWVAQDRDRVQGESSASIARE